MEPHTFGGSAPPSIATAASFTAPPQPVPQLPPPTENPSAPLAATATPQIDRPASPLFHSLVKPEQKLLDCYK